MPEAEDLPGRLRETDRAIGGVSIHLIRTHCGKDLAKAVVALKAASQEAASEIERLTTRLQSLEVENASLLGEVERPSEPGGFTGDIFFGDPRNSTRGTHRWDGAQWAELPSEGETLMLLLAEARAQRDTWRKTAERMVEEPDALAAALARAEAAEAALALAREGSWPVAEYVEELANVLWQMARGDFSRSWSTNFRNEIRSAPNIITIAGNQLAKLAAVARSSAKQIVGESSRDEHSSSPSGEVERLTTRLDAVEKALGEAVTVASLLYQNSELCARNHHWTTGGFTMPGWLADAAGTIDRARSALPQGEGK